jgi:hypothetical protein
VNRSAIASLDCCTIAVVSYFAVFTLIRIRVKQLVAKVRKIKRYFIEALRKLKTGEG